MINEYADDVTLKGCVENFKFHHKVWKDKRDSGEDMPSTQELHNAAQKIFILHGIEPSYEAIMKVEI